MKLIMQLGCLDTPNKVFSVTKKISNFKTDVEDVASIIFEYPKKIIQISLDMLQQVPKER